MLTSEQKEHLKTLLRKHVLFSLLEEEASNYLVDAAELVNFSLGESIINEGDRGDCAYFIHAGKVRVFKKTENGKTLTLATLNPSDLFGEYAVLRNEVRTASVRASEDVTLYRIRQTDFLALLRVQPALGESLDKLIRQRSLMDFLRLKTVLQPVPVQMLLNLVDDLHETRFESGETILRQGDKAQRFCIVHSGEVRVSRDRPEARGEAAQMIGYLAAGASFGDDCLLLNTSADAHYTATRDTVCLWLEPARFASLIEEVPALRASLLERLGRPDTAAAAPETPTSVAPAKDAQPAAPLPKKRRWWSRYPWIPQHDQSDCGAAALAMIAKYHGVRLSVGRLRETANIGREGATMLSLALAAEQIGFNARAVRTDFGHLTGLNLPAVAHWKGYHYIVVYDVRPDRVIVGDPGLGLVKMSRAEFEAGWTGRLLLLNATPRLAGQEPGGSTLKRFLPFLTPFRWLLAEVLLVSVLLETLRLALPIFTQVIVDRVLVHQNVNMLNVMLVVMLFLGVFQMTATFLRQYLLQHVGQKLGLAMSADLFRQVLRLPMHFFHTRKIGDFLVRFQDNQRIKEMLTGRAVTTLLDVLMIFSSLCLMLYYNAKLTLVALAVFPFYIGLALLYTPWLRQNNRQVFERKTHAESALVESIKSIGAIKDATAEQATRWKHEDLIVLQANMEYRGRRMSLTLEGMFRSIGIIGNLFLLWFGALLVIQQEMTVGQLMAFNALAALLAAPILGLVQLWFDIQSLAQSLQRLGDLYDAPAEQDAERAAVPLPRLQGHIKFDNVSFRYAPEDRNILCNITLEVRPGQLIALVGRSGAGKTTLAMLLQRYYLPTEGAVTVDGFDLANVDVHSLRDQLGVVAQESTIITGTIRENIALGDPEMPLEKVIEVARQANAHEFIMSFPLAYDTIVGDLGVRLSGGQRQRLAIARALLKEPRILILDEATGALDYESERAIQHNLQLLMRDRTTLVIAHRLSTVQNADVIVVMDNGAIVEQGTHTELTAKRGLYYYLTSQQLGE